VHHYDLGLKSQSLEYPDPTSPRKKKFKTQRSPEKCTLVAFLDYRGINHQAYMVKAMKINSKTYVKTPEMLK
jgi:hypothetical protein